MVLMKKYIEVTFIKNKMTNEREIINLKNENTNLTNRNKLITDEYDNSKIESNQQNEKLNNMM